MKKHFLFSITLLMACAMLFSFAACGGSDSDGDDNGGSGGNASSGWYIGSNTISNKINELSEGINLYNSSMTQSDFFASNGQFFFPQYGLETTGNTLAAYPSEWTSNGLAAIHIINDNTLEACFNGRTWKYGSSGTSGLTLLYVMDMGYVGMVGRYAEYTKLYTYYPEGNGFWFWDEYEGVYEFNFVNGQLYMNGGGTWVKYNPTETYYGNVKR